MTRLEELIAWSPEMFASAVKETEDNVCLLEDTLGVHLPADIRWFLTQCGSGWTSAVPSVRASTEDTIRFRHAVGLPSRYVVLADVNDGGVVFLDCSSADGAVFWVDSHAVERFAAGSFTSDDV